MSYRVYPSWWYFFSGPPLDVSPMCVEFNMPHIYFLSNISIVLRPMLAVLKLHCALVCVPVWSDFLFFLFIHISPNVSIRAVEFALNIYHDLFTPSPVLETWLESLRLPLGKAKKGWVLGPNCSKLNTSIHKRVIASKTYNLCPNNSNASGAPQKYQGDFF